MKINRIITELQVCVDKHHLSCDNGEYYLKEAIKVLKQVKSLEGDDS